MSRQRPSIWWWGAIALIVSIGGLWLLFSSPGGGGAVGSSERVTQTLEPASLGAQSELERAASARPERTSGPRAGATAARERGTGKPLTAEAERFRRRVLEAPSLRKGQPAASAVAGAGAVRERPPGTMVDRTGELSEGELHALNHELMPLVDECLEQAHERNPALKGMLAIDVELASAEGIGGVFETVEADPALNELDDDELIECVRQSSFSVQLPEAGRSGRMSRQLTIPFGESPARDAGR